MKINELHVRHFRCYGELAVSFDPTVNVFVGNNGAGKSAVLDAVAGAMFPYIHKLVHMSGTRKTEQSPLQESDLQILGEETASHVEFGLRLEEGLGWQVEYRRTQRKGSALNPSLQSRNLRDLWGFIGHLGNDAVHYAESPVPVVAYYRSGRNVSSLADVRTMSNRSFNRFESFTHALNASADYDDVAEWFFFREVEELRQGKERKDFEFELADLSEVRRAISAVIKPTSKVFFRQQKKATLMVEWMAHDGQRKEMTLAQLSDGFRNMLAIVMDFSRRMAQANPNLAEPLHGPGILLIDEIDLHLHPTWQQSIIPQLRSVFPNTQLIVTTHSPEVVTTVERHQVQILHNGVASPCPSPTYGMKTSDVVRSVLGLENLRPDNEVSRDIKALFDAIDKEDLDRAKEIRLKLSGYDNQGFDPDLTRADMRIRRLERGSDK